MKLLHHCVCSTEMSCRSGGWSERSLPLATVLLTPWPLFQGASQEVIDRAREEGDDELLKQGGTALEVNSNSLERITRLIYICQDGHY